MSYWDIQSFLSEQQPALLRFTQDADDMAFIDIYKGMTGTIPADSPINVSIWVVSVLRDYLFRCMFYIILADSELVKVDVPKYLQRDQNEGYYKSMQNDKSAKLQSINLREKSIYFYKIYQAIQKTLENNKNLIQASQVKTMMMQRGSSIIERASMHQQQSKAQSKFNNYVEFQRKIYRTIRAKTLQYENWQCKKQL